MSYEPFGRFGMSVGCMGNVDDACAMLPEYFSCWLGLNSTAEVYRSNGIRLFEQGLAKMQSMTKN